MSTSSTSYTGSMVMYWNMNTEPDLAGYRVYVGYSPRVYELIQDVGLTGSTGQPSVVVNGVLNNLPTYATVTAYDNSGNESTYGAEVSLTRPVPLLTLLRRVH